MLSSRAKRRTYAFACAGCRLVASKPLFAEILSVGIDGNDQRNLLDPQQSLDLLLAFNRISDVLKSLEIHKSINFVLTCKLRTDSRLVLAHSAYKIAGNARVERLRSIRHDVNKVRFRRTRVHRSFASLRMTNLELQSREPEVCDEWKLGLWNFRNDSAGLCPHVAAKHT